MDELQREAYDLARRIGGNICFAFLVLIALDLAALWLGYKCLTGNASPGETVATLAFIGLSIAATVWYLLRFAAAIGSGHGM
jgi:hypothetical protein